MINILVMLSYASIAQNKKAFRKQQCKNLKRTACEMNKHEIANFIFEEFLLFGLLSTKKWEFVEITFECVS